VETDSPYLTPVPPYRGKRNEPAYVRLVAEAIAKIKGDTFSRSRRADHCQCHKSFPITHKIIPLSWGGLRSPVLRSQAVRGRLYDS
jgi:hypothetical protein